MSRFDNLPDSDKARHAQAAIGRVLAGSRLREHDASALMFAAELVAERIHHELPEPTAEELADANDFFDKLVKGANHGL